MPDPSLTIITGSSRGLGQALAAQLLRRGDTVLGIARSASTELARLAGPHSGRLEQWCADLQDAGPAAERLADWLAQARQRSWREVRLINNAGLIPRIAPLSRLTAQDIGQGLRVGLEAAMVLSAAFLQATAGWGVPRKVLNISSGLGRRPMASQAVYCAAKAGMDHFSRCLALEQRQEPNGARVCALAPGVVATDMQAHLRNADPQDFPDLDRFQSLHANDQLASAEDTAHLVLARLDRADFGEPVIADVRD